jgi:(R,R)-butanediol dehydrogenase/meso-butanediol dehydrogenase/diacetyl reductase
MWDVDVAAAIALLAGNSIDTKPLLTDVIALDEVVSKGFDRLLNDKNAFKIVVDTTR